MVANLFAGVKWKCTACGKPSDPNSVCECMVRCECGTINLRGETCSNGVWHVSKKFAEEVADQIIADMASGYRMFQTREQIIARLKRTIVRRVHALLIEAFDEFELKEKKP